MLYSLQLHDQKQEDDYSCGCAAVTAVIDYFIEGHSKKYIRDIVQPSKIRGCSRKRVVDSLAEFNIKAEYRSDLTVGILVELIKLKKPVIVTVWPEDYGSDHWTVVEAIDLHAELISLTNYKTISIEEFEKQWFDYGEGLVCNWEKP